MIDLDKLKNIYIKYVTGRSKNLIIAYGKTRRWL